MLNDFENKILSVGPTHLDESVGLLEQNLPTKEPIGQFKKWFTEICKNPDLKFPAAMFLATVNSCGRVSNRVMYCRGYNKNGFLFYTDYLSPKATDLIQNPYAAATFFWGEINRSVRIEGICKLFTEEEADHHFKNLSNDERVATRLGRQSEPLNDRYLTFAKYEGLRKQDDNNIKNLNEVKKPKFWGGFILHPHRIEFWEGRHNGIHDRINFKKPEEDSCDYYSAFNSGVDYWTFQRLIP